jgi:hypothetical protein
VTEQALTPLGWTFLIVSVTFVTVLVVWCYGRVLSLPRAEAKGVKDLHSA